MKVKCLNCGSEIELWRLEHDENNPEGFYTSCMECHSSFDIDEEEILSKIFITDIAKMADFKVLTKEEFLESYSYLTEDEYDATALYLNWLNADDSEPKRRNNMTLYEENLIEIAWVDEYLSLNDKYEEDTDSMDEKMAIIDLAKKFEEENKEKDWELKGDYYEEIFKYAERELLKLFGKEN